MGRLNLFNGLSGCMEAIMKKYQIIYADPPWKYDFSATKNRNIENQYPTMELQEIKSLKIPSAKF